MGQAAAQGATVADLRMGHFRHGCVQQRRNLRNQRVAFQPALAGHGAQAQPAVRIGPDMMTPRLRRVLRWTAFAAVLVALLAGLYSCMISMPGKSHQGPLPPLTPSESALASALRRDVVELATTIGERNVVKYAALKKAADYVDSGLRVVGPVSRHTYPADGRDWASRSPLATSRTISSSTRRAGSRACSTAAGSTRSRASRSTPPRIRAAAPTRRRSTD